MKTVLLLISMLVLVASALAGSDDENAEDILLRIGQGNVVLGKAKSESELCQGCHGETGINAVSSYPFLAGQYSAYILKQLRNFKTGERNHQIMNGMAEHLSEDDMSDIAAYFASNKKNKGESSEVNQLGKNLFIRGDIKRDILPCVSCHGDAGKGATSGDDVYPLIGGQHKLYLREQLFNWRSGARRNGPGGAMNIVAKSLTDAEIEALANYISGL